MSVEDLDDPLAWIEKIRDELWKGRTDEQTLQQRVRRVADVLNALASGVKPPNLGDYPRVDG